MAETRGFETQADQVPQAGAKLAHADHWMSELSDLLQELRQATSAGAPAAPVVSPQTDNELVQVRLGIAASLFTALRCKHPPAAAHALRVALSTSGWCLMMGLPDKQRDVIEIAALLHDVGMVGVPDQILLKPGALDSDETRKIERSRKMSLEILRCACAEPAILDIVENVPAWYDGSKSGYRVTDQGIPLGARMIAIVEAFDAMTSDRVFRPAMSHERAMSELFRCSGRQFDRQLVEQFAELQRSDRSELRREVTQRWFRSLDPDTANSYWTLSRTVSPSGDPNVDALFQAKLLGNMYDAVVFVDENLTIKLWNHGAERLTAVSSSSVCQRRWLPELLDMQNEKGEFIPEADCPVAWAISSGVQSLRRLTIWGRTGRPVSVDTHAIPVLADDGTTLGAVLLLHDASSEISLEERCQSLHEKATKDPLTQVANRAEFDRVHEMFVAAHLQQQVPCSLIICDLDHFKQVNDTYGHQAGDDVIRSMATLMKNSCRPGDLVARYGGEEFVVLCANCDTAAVTERAEQIRKSISQLPQARMAGRPVTASFGVTEIQPGDTAETMLRRADRALLEAKAQGRNTVVQLGTGSHKQEQAPGKRFWGRGPARHELLLEQDLLTPVPIKVAVEKLRGFVADHEAKITEISGNKIQLQIDDSCSNQRRRRADRPVTFTLDLRLEEETFEKSQSEEPAERGNSRTKIHVSISPKKNRDRRRADVLDRARQVLISFRSYLMATEDGPPVQGVLRRAKCILTPWLMKR